MIIAVLHISVFLSLLSQKRHTSPVLRGQGRDLGMELCLINWSCDIQHNFFLSLKEIFIRLCTLPNFLALPLPLSWWWPVTLNNCGLLPEKYFHVWHMFGLKRMHPVITPPNSPPLFLPSNQPSFKSMLKCPYPLWILSPATKHKLLSSCWCSQTM